MGVAYGVHLQRFASRPAIHFRSQLQRPPRAIDEVALRVPCVVHVLDVEVGNVGAGVRECPREITGEPQYHARTAGNGHARDVELPRDDEVHFVPQRRQGHVEMGIARQQRIPGFGSPRCDRPVVAAQGVLCTSARRDIPANATDAD